MDSSIRFGGADKRYYYFAYGSNMDPRQMRRRCPDAEYVGNAVLPDYDFDFTRYSPQRDCGVMDVVPKPGAAVWGGVYRLNQRDLDALDRAEGIQPGENDPYSYRRAQQSVYLNGHLRQTPIVSEVYEVVTKKPAIYPSDEFKPSRDYLNTILTGARARSLPSEYVERLQRVVTRFGARFFS